MMLAINWANVALITVFGIGMVFFILLVLVLILVGFGKLTNLKKSPKVEKHSPKAQVKTDASEAEKAAIAMALHLYFAEVHDSENPVFTLKSKKTAWNDKMFGMNNLVK